MSVAAQYADIVIEDGIIIKNRYGLHTRSASCKNLQRIAGESLYDMLQQAKADGENVYVFTEKQLEAYEQAMKRGA